LSTAPSSLHAARMDPVLLERLQEMCAQAAKENDVTRLIRLVQGILAE